MRRKILLLAALTLGLSLAAHADDGTATASYTTSTFSAGSTYVLKVKGEYQFLTHGGSWGTEAITGDFAIPFALVSNSDGTTYYLSNIDYTAANSADYYMKYGTASSYYVDGYSNDGTTTDFSWTIETTDGGYLLKDKNGYYITTGSGSNTETNYTYNYFTGTTDSGSAIVWELLDTAEYRNALADMMDVQAAATAELGGLDLSSVSDFSSHSFAYTKDLTDDYVKNDSMQESADYWNVTGKGYGTSGNLTYYSLSSYSSYLNNDGVCYVGGVGSFWQGIQVPYTGGVYKVTCHAVFSPGSIPDFVLTYVTKSGMIDLTWSTISSILKLAGASTLSTSQKAELSSAYLFAESSSQTVRSQVKAPPTDASWKYSKDVLNNALDDYENTFYVYVGPGDSLVIGGAMDGRTPSSVFLPMNWELSFVSDVVAKVNTAVTSISDGDFLEEAPTTFTATYSYAWTLDESTYPLTGLKQLNGSAVATITDASGNNVGTASLTYSTNDDGYPVLTANLSSLSSKFEAGKSYTLTIPAGVVGWNNDLSNDAQSITFTVALTSLDFEGDSSSDDVTKCYLKLSGDEVQYLSRGSTWGQRALTDSYGMPVGLAYSSDDKAWKVQFLDNSAYLYEADLVATTIYTDGSTYNLWQLQKTDDGYAIYDANTGASTYGNPVYVTSDGTLAVATDADTEPAVWTLESLSDHKTYLLGLEDSVAVNAAADAGITVSSKSDLTDALANWQSSALSTTTSLLKYAEGSGDVTEGYQLGGGWAPTATTLYARELTGLSEGLYKISVPAYYRNSTYSNSYSVYSAGDLTRGPAFIEVNGVRQQVMSFLEDGEQETQPSTGSYVQLGSSYYVNDTIAGAYLFKQGEYGNEVYAYVGSEGTLTVSVIREVGYQPDSWLYYNDTVHIYHYDYLPVTITSAGYATLYYGAYNLTVPDGVTAYTASVTQTTGGFTAALTSVGTVIPAKTAVILQGEAGTYNFSIASGSYDAISSNDLWGVDEEETHSSNDSLFYHLSLNKNKDANSVGFYWYSSDGHSITCTPHKAFVTLPASAASISAEAGIRFVFTDDATAISSVTADEKAGVKGTYTLTGLKLDADAQALPAGVYIIDGKKVLIK